MVVLLSRLPFIPLLVASWRPAHHPTPNPYATLTAVTAVWGSQHSVIKWAVGEGDASSLTLVRFGVAACCLAPWLPLDRGTWRAGAELGLWSFAGFAAQAVGLETTTATKSAFLLYLNVKLVPVLNWGLGRPPAPAVWFWAATALAGTYCLATDSDQGGSFVDGDAWSAVAALMSAAFIVRLDDLAPRAAGSAQLASASALATAGLAAVWAESQGIDLADVGANQNQLLAACYLGVGPSAACGFLQAAVQPRISANRAAIIYALDPLWAAAFADLLLDEHLSLRGQIGAALVAAAAIAQPLQDVLLGDADAPAAKAETTSALTANEPRLK